jgi:MEMO1 family protein
MSKFFGGTFESIHGTRVARFAGTWYNANGSELNQQLTEFLAKAEKEMQKHPLEREFPGGRPVGANILAAIVPHAGYLFSGQTAAFAYEELKSLSIKRVFLLGPSHYRAFYGVALPSQSTFATPLGPLKVDEAVVRELSQFPYFQESKEVHDQEHSLELQLPLIRKVFGDVAIVPLAVGLLENDHDIRLIASILRRYIGTDDIVIISSDFTHYGPRFEFEPFTENIPEKIKELDQAAFECLQNADLEAWLRFREKTHDTICGFYPCAILLAMLPRGSHGTLLKYETSQQIVYDPDQNSVSYLAIVFSNDDAKTAWQTIGSDSELDNLTEADGKALIKVARQSIESYLHKQEPRYDDFLTPEQQDKFKELRGAFVTLFLCDKHKDGREPGALTRVGQGTALRPEDKKLRGCIGYSYPVKPLLQAVKENALSAATKDPRFVPLQNSELKSLEIEVSVLSSPRPIKSWHEIKLGVDGVIMHKHGQQAVFLPCVATEFGWNLEELLTQLSLKANCGPQGWRDGAFFDVFQARAFEESAEAESPIP